MLYMIEYKPKPAKVTEPSDDLPQRIVDSIINPKVKARLDVMPEYSNYQTE